MTPEDFPMEHVASTEGDMRSLSTTMHSLARDAVKAGNLKSAVAIYESALAYADAGRRVLRLGQQMASTIAEKADQERDLTPIPWPIPFLEDLSAVHPHYVPDGSPLTPRWGVEGESGSSDTMAVVTFQPSLHAGAVILRASESSTTQAHNPNGHREVSVLIDPPQWSALRAWGDRIAHQVETTGLIPPMVSERDR